MGPLTPGTPVPPNHDLVRVYWAQVTDCDPGLFDLLDAVERARHANYRRAVDADRFLLGVAMVRTVAGRYLGCSPRSVTVDRRCPDCDRPHGKVLLPGSDLQLSVSHSGDLVGLACHLGASVGLDVEPLDRLDTGFGKDVATGLTEQVLAPSERDCLADLDASDRLSGFLRYWTRKEALVKATGDGLRVDLRGLVVSGPGQPPAVLESRHLPGDELTLYDLVAAPGHVAALAVRRRHPVRVEELPARPLLDTWDRPLSRNPGSGLP